MNIPVKCVGACRVVGLSERTGKVIDGIVSGKLLLKPKVMKTQRGSDYVIAKMKVYGYMMGKQRVADIHGDIIAFDKELCCELVCLDKDSELSVCGVIVPAREIYLGQETMVLKITARLLLSGYFYGQSLGKGSLFSLVK